MPTMTKNYSSVKGSEPLKLAGRRCRTVMDGECPVPAVEDFV
jgi:hypothetical protein